MSDAPLIAPAVSLEVPLELLKKEKKHYRSLFTEATFEAVGGNGILEAEPQILKFAGFELNKINTRKLKIRNTSGMARRTHILPPTTKQFNFAYDKKGILAPGMSEEIFIQFTPEDFKYHYDCLRLQAESANFIVPIHAFPVMNKKRPIVPKFVDMGTKMIGDKARKAIELVSEIPIDFEYEIFIRTNHK